MLLLTKGIIHLRLGSFCQLSRPCAVDGSMIDGWDKRSTTNDTSGWLRLVGGWTNSLEKYARLNWIILPGTLNVILNLPRKRSLSLSLSSGLFAPTKRKRRKSTNKSCTRYAQEQVQLLQLQRFIHLLHSYKPQIVWSVANAALNMSRKANSRQRNMLTVSNAVHGHVLMNSTKDSPHPVKSIRHHPTN